MPKKFWQFRNQLSTGAELFLYGEISDHSWWDDDVTAKSFLEDLNGLGAVSEITVHINSGGGDVFAAQTIGNMLEQHSARTVAQIDGLCASAATIIACHCNKVIAANDSTYMIHPVRMGVFDYVDADQLKQYLSALEKLRENIITLYSKKTGRDIDEIAELMDATTWWTGAEAKENGFVDELTDDEGTVVENRNGMLFINSINMNMPVSEAPKSVQDRIKAIKAGSGSVNTNSAKNTPETIQKEENMEETIKTVDGLREAYPELVAQIEQEAAESATQEERQRIQEIDEMTPEGGEELANDAKFANPISADAFAKRALKNVKSIGNRNLQRIGDDVKNSGVNDVKGQAEQGEGQKVDEFLDAIRNVNKKEDRR